MRRFPFLALSFLLFIPPISLARDQDAQVFIDRQNGEPAIRASYPATGSLGLQGVKEGDKEWRERTRIQPGGKKIIEARAGLGVKSW